MKWLAIPVLVLLTVPAAAKDMLFWNETGHEFTGVFLAPAGSGRFGPNQTANDPDHSVSADERLKITATAPGRYDVRLTDKAGRTCLVWNVTVKGTGRVAFAIGEEQLTDCTPR